MAEITINNSPTDEAGEADFRKYKETARRYEEAAAAQEILEKSLQQYAQEGQEVTEISQDIVKQCSFDAETGAIIVNGNKMLALDPQNPHFNKTLYSSYVNAINENLKASLELLKTEVDKSAGAVMNTEAMQSVKEVFKDTLEPLLKNLTELFSNIINGEDFAQLRQEWQELQPYIDAELEKPEYKGKKLEELTDEQIEQVAAAAKAAMLAKALPIINVNSKVQSVDYPLDKINSNIFNLLTTADTTGQLTLRFAAEKRGSRKTADIIYSIDFAALEQESGVTITKKLTAFDKRVYIAAGALFNNGFEVVTVAQIYSAMGNTGRPASTDIKKINDSLTKMQAAHIYLDNSSESSIYKYDKFVYDASLLPMERKSAVINGQTVDSAIHLFREPPLISFARGRKQITTIKRNLLESPLSKTDANLLIDDYLLERISHIKNSKGKISNKLLYSTIYEKCGIKSKMQRSRAKEKINKYLAHYKNCKFIKDYKEDADGITIIY